MSGTSHNTQGEKRINITRKKSLNDTLTFAGDLHPRGRPPPERQRGTLYPDHNPARPPRKRDMLIPGGGHCAVIADFSRYNNQFFCVLPRYPPACEKSATPQCSTPFDRNYLHARTRAGTPRSGHLPGGQPVTAVLKGKYNRQPMGDFRSCCKRHGSKRLMHWQKNTVYAG